MADRRKRKNRGKPAQQFAKTNPADDAAKRNQGQQKFDPSGREAGPRKREPADVNPVAERRKLLESQQAQSRFETGRQRSNRRRIEAGMDTTPGVRQVPYNSPEQIERQRQIDILRMQEANRGQVLGPEFIPQEQRPQQLQLPPQTPTTTPQESGGFLSNLNQNVQEAFDPEIAAGFSPDASFGERAAAFGRITPFPSGGGAVLSKGAKAVDKINKINSEVSRKGVSLLESKGLGGKIFEKARGVFQKTTTIKGSKVNTSYANKSINALLQTAKKFSNPAWLLGVAGGYLFSVTLTFNDKGDAAGGYSFQAKELKKNKEYDKLYEVEQQMEELRDFHKEISTYAPVINYPLGAFTKVEQAYSNVKDMADIARKEQEKGQLQDEQYKKETPEEFRKRSQQENIAAARTDPRG